MRPIRAMPNSRHYGPTGPFNSGNINRARLQGLSGNTTSSLKVDGQTAAVGSAVAAGLAAAGTAVLPGIGTAIGFAIGAIAGALIHTGQGPQRAAQSTAITQALAGISTANHQGAAIPWIGSATNPGLQQFLQALMTHGVWMSWDPSLISSPAVNGNWANTFIAAIKKVTAAIMANPVGKQVCLDITDKPGGNDAVQGQFCFTNPGIGVGPDVIAQKIIMGNGGLMYWMIKRTGETDAHASANAGNAAAEKVFALMVDHAAYDLTPVPPAAQPAPPPAPIPTPAQVIQTVAPTQSQTQIVPPPAQVTAVPVTGTTSAGTPIVAPNNTDALIAQLMAQGASQQQALNAAIASLQANGVNTNQPQVQQQLQSAVQPSGLSTKTMLLIGAAGIGIYYLAKK